MTKLRFLLLVAIILQLPFYSFGQFSREQAKDLVLNQILAADTGHINVYSSYDAKSDPNGLILIDNRHLSLPYASNWVFLSDDDPFAYWGHPCRYVIVNSSNGDYTIDSADIYPVDFKTGYEIILQIQGPTILTPPCSDITPTTTVSPNPHLHAVLISGGDDPKYRGDLALIYNTLKEAGYLKVNITVLYNEGLQQGLQWNGDLDGDNVSDINDAAYHDVIDLTFSNLTGQEGLGTEDQLFVYTTSTGDWDVIQQMSYICIPVNPNLPNSSPEYTSKNLVDHVHNISCAQMIFVMQNCHSGGFIDPLCLDQNPDPKCKNRIVQTAVDWNEIAHPEWYITGGNSYGEFTYYWSAAARGYYPGTVPWKWSCKVGDFPFNTWAPDPHNWNYQGHPADYNPDNGDPTSLYGNGVIAGNIDGYTQFIEAFNYANCMDTWSPNGYYNIYPNGFSALPENPDKDINNGFSSDDLFCLNGIAGNTSTSFVTQTVDSRSYLLGGPLNILSPMTIYSYANFTMGVNHSIIEVDQNKQLNVLDYVTFTGISPTSDNGLYIQNTNNNLTLDHATFSNAYIENYGSVLTVNNSSFTNCPVVASHRGKVTIQYNSIFTNSPLFLENQDYLSTEKADVSGCFFYGNNISGEDIMLTEYENFSISNNHIYGAEYYGIGLYFCGHGIDDHTVESNEIKDCNQSGMIIHNSNVLVTMNQIHDNQFGIKMLDNSNTSLTGDQNAHDYSGTQEINDNTGIDLYATTFCFPYYMRFNAINNDGINNTNPYVYYDEKCLNFAPILDVRYNCWGNIQDPSTVLYANCGPGAYYYEYDPVWCPSKGGNIQLDVDEDMYNTATNDVNAENYTDAKSVFQLLVETYPKSEYALAAMKELFSIEPYAGNDFNGLRNYYLTNDSIMADTALTKLGDFLANRCNVQMENWPDAISWYEDKIQNPEIETDSIFAIIDLGHLYMMMDSTNKKSAYIGSLPQYKPESKVKYVTYRDSLISLLPFPKDQQKKSINKLQNGQLLQNVPNPSNSSTEIYFKLLSASNAAIKIYDCWGRLNREIPVTDLKDGIHKIIFNTSILSPGVYEYSLSVNNQITDSKRMIVIR